MERQQHSETVSGEITALDKTGLDSGAKYKDKAQMFDTKYQKTAVSIMEQAKEKFLVAFKSINYKQGTATSILSDIMKKC